MRSMKTQILRHFLALSVISACCVSVVRADEGIFSFSAGDTGKASVEKDCRVEGVRIDIGMPGNKVNNGQLHIAGPGKITVGAGGIRDVTKAGRYCVFRCPIAFAADQTIDCSGREQMYFYGRLSDADPDHPARLLKTGPRDLYVGEGAGGSPLSAPIRVDNGSICFHATNSLGTAGGIEVVDKGRLWYGGGVNGRDVVFGRSCTAPVQLFAGVWGKTSRQSGKVEFQNQKPSIKVSKGHDMTFADDVSFTPGAAISIVIEGGSTMHALGKWSGRGAAISVSGSGTLSLDRCGVFDDGAMSLRLLGGTIELNGTTQRVASLDVAFGAKVMGPGVVATAAGMVALPVDGMIGGENPAPPAVEASTPGSGPIDVGDRLQLLWDDHLVDAAKTTATRLMHTPRFAETAYVFDHPWEGDCCFYQVLVKDEGLLRIYYKAPASGLCAIHSPGVFKPKKISSPCCYIESRDGGLTWTAPDLGLVELCGGSKHNNCVLDESRDNFFVMKDTNPACPPEERYKGVSMWGAFNKNGTPDFSKGRPGLWCYVSPDGTHFKRSHLMTSKGAFDSINTAWWDAGRGEYHAFVRGYHRVAVERNNDCGVRDIMHMTSKDFREWTVPKRLDFGPDAEDYPLYTNVIQPYYRDPSIYIGFPSRYVERKKWSDSYDKLCAPDKRKYRMAGGRNPRGGLTLWDTIFCFSRDAQRFERFDEAMFRPGPEHPCQNWAYGDTMVAVGLLETPARFGTDPEISMFLVEGAHLGVPNKLNRYVIRLDGFVSRHATYAEQRLVTKPIVFSGKELTLNFSTSARGRIFLAVRDGAGRVLRSAEIFGDKVDRVVGFEGGSLADFAGRPVTLEFRMSDADIYSFRFR